MRGFRDALMIEGRAIIMDTGYQWENPSRHMMLAQSLVGEDAQSMTGTIREYGHVAIGRG
jgi:hypothetical protein